jgi:ABC-type nickel/cobalt efflux system permease component RcnA
MKTPTELHDSIAAAGASTSMVTAIAAKATEFQPIISATSGLIAIITGLFAIAYYVRKMNKDGQDSEQSN